ncbi:alpha/beta family hydrolase [Rhizobium tumorigenes]|uniref:Alpha/beta hydrolase n=1 Tax=Rhizobium tumorigenes TaxID=2041385 RepID=A0AAF1KRE1_9HYPH|nr:alpha/beta family hydrolase [Rhizobium tumorigenes]WFR96642.1 alpha/beta hydrolase [Rhizobium tumorigenes]
MTSVLIPEFLLSGGADAPYTILLAHGAGGPMDSGSMSAASDALATAGFRVARFEFAYMAARRISGVRRPPPKAEMLMEEYRTAVTALGSHGRLIIGGKSMGGRVASMIADELRDDKVIIGLLCLGYPFHPPGKPDSLRTAHLRHLRTPTLICQGTRDLLGCRDEVLHYDLSDSIELLWLEDGDHDLRPRKTISGHSAAEHLATMANAAMQWAQSAASLQ